MWILQTTPCTLQETIVYWVHNTEKGGMYSMVWYKGISSLDVDDLIFGSDDQVIRSER